MSQSWFVTGTDTGVGKTWCSLALIQYFKNQGLRVAGINHALLSAEAIIGDGCTLAGWIANPIDSDFNGQASIETLSERLDVPLLAEMPYLDYQKISSLISCWTGLQTPSKGQL